jgi:hypothetical protein
MKCLESENNEMVKYLFVNECQLYGMTDDDIQFVANIHSRLIMGSWIEVKDA